MIVRKMLMFMLVLFFVPIHIYASEVPTAEVLINDYNSTSAVYVVFIDIPTDSYAFADVTLWVNGTGLENMSLSFGNIVNMNHFNHVLSLWTPKSTIIYDEDRDGLINVSGKVIVRFRTCQDTTFSSCSNLQILELNYSRKVFLPVNFDSKKSNVRYTGK